MKFVRVDTLLDGVAPLRDRLVRELSEGRKVLWLLTGGSSISLSVSVMNQLPDELTTGLTAILSDERYGDVGHKDSNAHQLDQAGFVPKHGVFIPVLRDGLSIQETRTLYDQNFQNALHQADVVIAQFGMGADGHIAGILPGSPAITSDNLAAAYDTPQFARITLTPKALLQITAAYLYVFGNDRRSPLEQLESEMLPVATQPAQLLKQLPEAYVYNNQIGSIIPDGQNGEVV